MSAMLAATHPTVPDTITFVIGAVVIMAGAIGVVVSRNAVHAALSLVMTLLGVALLFIELQAEFLAVVQVIVYAGAIVVLFLFVIMFLGVDRRENIAQEPLRGQRPFALVCVAVALGGVLALGINSHWATGQRSVVGPIGGSKHSNVYLLGKALYTTYLYAFEATAALLVIAVVGAVVLARRTRREETGVPPAIEESVGADEGPEAGEPVAQEPAAVVREEVAG
jgi:NADH-quinone oxidoreductase subunit J